MSRSWWFALAGVLMGCGSSETKCERPGFDCDVQLDPPTSGFQLVAGPMDVPEGTEMLRCFWRKAPADVDVNDITIRYNNGSHHLDIFTVPYSMADGDFDCSKPEEWGSWPSEVAKGLDPTSPLPKILVGFQNDAIDWKLPDGVAYQVKAGQQIMIQSHFANVASQKVPTDRMLNLINFSSGDLPVVNRAETLFDEDFDIRIPPKSEATITRICEFPDEVNIIGLFGHFHSRGKTHRIYQYDAETMTTGALLYENTDWDEPVWGTLDDWGAPAKTRAIKMVADYYNFEDREIVWGNFVQENEHFETYAMFYPFLGVDQSCACHREGEEAPGVAAGNCN